MKRAYGLTGDDRKQMVAIIGEVTGVKPEYLRMPSCAYAIGGITVTKDGTMVWDGRTSDSTISRIEEKLAEVGLIAAEQGVSTEQTVITEQDTSATEESESAVQTVITENSLAPEESVSGERSPETTGLIISFPLDGGSSGEAITEATLQNLQKLIASKATLIKKALDADQLDVEVTDTQISFPWWNELPTPEEVAAYSEFLTELVKMAKEAKRVTAVEKPVESEKYSFRVFLLRIGFGGAEHKKTRSILLKKLSGHSAFPTKAAADAFYARQREKKAKLAVITEAPAEAVEPEEVTEE